MTTRLEFYDVYLNMKVFILLPFPQPSVPEGRNRSNLQYYTITNETKETAANLKMKLKIIVIWSTAIRK